MSEQNTPAAAASESGDAAVLTAEKLLELRKWWDAFASKNTPQAIVEMCDETIALRTLAATQAGEIVELRKALEFYRDEAIAIAHNFGDSKTPLNPEPLIASCVVLKLDAGRRANLALARSPSSGEAGQRTGIKLIAAEAAAASESGDVSVKMFPIQSERGASPHPMRIPWSVAEKAYSVYRSKYGSGQTLERLAERGGFGPGEMDMFLPGWRDECSELESLRTLATAQAGEITVLIAALMRAKVRCETCGGTGSYATEAEETQCQHCAEIDAALARAAAQTEAP